MTIYSLEELLSQFWNSPLFHTRVLLLVDSHSGGLVLLTLLRIFQFVMIHIVKGFSIVDDAEVDIFLEFLCFLYDPTNIGNLISGSSAFSKLSFCIWKFSVHVLLKPSLKDFKHYLASMWNERYCMVVWTFFGIDLLWDWDENWPFPVLWPLLSFPNLLTSWMQQFNSNIF